MKFAKQALDWRNPRSLWHRAICSTVCECVLVSRDIGLFVLPLITVIPLAAHLLFHIVVPLIFRISIALRMDDSDHLLNSLIPNGTFGHFPAELRRAVELEQDVVGGAAVGALAAALYTGFVGRAALLRVVLVLFTLLPSPALLILVPVTLMSIVGGVMGAMTDIASFVFGMTLNNKTDFSAIHMIRNVTTILIEQKAGFYSQVAAAGCLVGFTVGAAAFYCVYVVAPLYLLFRRCYRDYEETVNDIV